MEEKIGKCMELRLCRGWKGLGLLDQESLLGVSESIQKRRAGKPQASSSQVGYTLNPKP